ncbi:MAG: pyruvate synthase, partial [Clostridia bacterium]|nr:pyruvate synthase [Clostridia bacterium]
KLAEAVSLPIVIAFDGFFTSHQKRTCLVFENDQDVLDYLGSKPPAFSLLDFEHPITIGSYMNEPDIQNNKYNIHLAMEQANELLPSILTQFSTISGRKYELCDAYRHEDADILLLLLGSSYHTAKEAVDLVRNKKIKAGIITVHVLRPFPGKELATLCKNAKTIIACDRQDSYGGHGGNLSIELRAALQTYHTDRHIHVLSRVYGLGGQDFYVEDAVQLIEDAMSESAKSFSYFGIKEPLDGVFPKPSIPKQFFAPLSEQEQSPSITSCHYDEDLKKMIVSSCQTAEFTRMPNRLAPGHAACPGCGIPVNVNLLLKGIEGNVILLFHTGCGMVVTTGYPKTSFRIPYLHNLFQNGAATLSGVEAAFHELKRRGEYPQGDVTFIMISGDGGMDIGMGSALGSALRNQHIIMFEYDNGGYMNTGYQLSYSTPKGAKSATSHIGKYQYGKSFFHKDTPQIMAAANIPYIATVAESNPVDFVKKAAKAAAYAKEFGTVYLKALSACPLNWSDPPNLERQVIQAAVDCCYFPLYEIEQGITTLNYDPQAKNKKIPVLDWLSMMGRTKHLKEDCYQEIVNDIQAETDRRFARLKARFENPML